MTKAIVENEAELSAMGPGLFANIPLHPRPLADPAPAQEAANNPGQAIPL